MTDNNDFLPPNISRNNRNLPGSWVLGNAQLDSNATNLTTGVLYPHVGSTGNYRCPNDRFALLGSPSVPRLRSYSLNGWVSMGDFVWEGITYPNKSDPAPPSRRWAQFRGSAISQLVAFIEDHEQNIDDGAFLISENQFPNSPIPNTWMELPSERHNQGCNLSFLDGHTEHHRWGRPKQFRAHLTPATTDLQDLRWLQDHLPRLR